VKIKGQLGRLRSRILTRLDPFEILRMRRMRRDGTLIAISDLIPTFNDSTFFAFATGGSLSNIEGLERTENHNTLMLTTAPIHFFKMYGAMPNLWLIHNSPSVRMAIETIHEYGLHGKIDFSNTIILVPENSSKSKVNFSDISMRRLRKVLGNTTYALYSEKIYSEPEVIADFASKKAVPDHYLQTGVEPIELMNGSSVETVILPFLSFLGVREIYFGGVDHRDTGHFWDRNDPWQEEDGTPKSFTDTALVEASGKAALKEIESKNISVYRLEAEMTTLTHYEHIEFETALQRATKRPNNRMIKDSITLRSSMQRNPDDN
jgi:hypothetical protein